MGLYFKAVHEQLRDRVDGVIPDVESYISLRRDASACKACFALLEYAQGIELPEKVLRHPTVLALAQTANDVVAWSTVSRPVPPLPRASQER